MRRFTTVKPLITTGFIAYIFYIFAVTWFQIGTQYSSDAAEGFMMGLIYMAGLFVAVKSVRYLSNDFNSWLTERKRKRAREKILSCKYEKAKYVKLIPIILVLVMLVCSCADGNLPGATIPDSTPVVASPDISVQQPSFPPQGDVTEPPQSTQQIEAAQPSQSVTQAEIPELEQPASLEDSLQVYFFDVGQADCILVKTGQHSMLIDSGDTGQGSLILGYLSDRGKSTLDYLVATHPHADHIGSMPDILRDMESVGSLLMPDIVHTTKTFEDLLDAIEDTDTPVIIPQPGEIFGMGNARIQILAPNNSAYDDLNNYSIVLRVDFGQSSFLFTGDAEDISESEQLANVYVLQTDIIKIGHHGQIRAAHKNILSPYHRATL